MAPNGPTLNQYSTTHTVGNSLTSNSHSHTQTLDKPMTDYMSPEACHTVNRKFIKDLLLPKRVSTYIWSDVIVNKPLNNNYHNNTDFLVPENLVLNMSELRLTDNQISIISRGLSFCPTPGEPDMGQVFLDLEKLFRKMRLTLFWAEDQSQNTSGTGTQSVFTQNNTTIPPYHNRDFIAKSTFDPIQFNPGLEPFQKAVKH